MDRERLNELLQDPSQVAKEDLGDLRTMAEQFPWFSGAHLLLAVGEHESGNVLANDRHSTPAAYLPSRAVLFDLAQQAERPAAPMHVVKDDAPLPTQAPPPDPVREPESAAELKAEGKPAPGPNATTLQEPTVQDAAPTDSGPAPEPEAPVAKDPAARPPGAAEADILERQIQEAIHASGYAMGQLGHLAPEAGPAAPAPMPTPHPEEAVPEAAHVEAAVAEPVAPGTRLGFTAWLEQASPVQPPAPPTTPAPAPTTSRTEAEAQPPAVAASPSASGAKELMEQFIQRSDPPIIKPKAAFFNPQKAAKQSLQDDGLVSETLARIHEKQGHFAKAREVYERLAVKHPEKSVYFAALSKALEARSNK